MRLKARRLRLDLSTTCSAPLPGLQPAPSNPAEAVVDWLQVRAPGPLLRPACLLRLLVAVLACRPLRCFQVFGMGMLCGPAAVVCAAVLHKTQRRDIVPEHD